MTLPILPLANIEHVILIVEGARTMVSIVFKVSLVGFSIPPLGSQLLLEVMVSVPMLLIVDPISDIVVAVCPYLPSKAVSAVVGPPTFVECAIFPGVFALALSNFSFLPHLALVVAI